jgi:MscS family membrane protein
MMLAQPKLDPASVTTRLIRFGDASLELEVFAYVPTLDDAAFLDIQEDLLLRIMDIVEASGASFSLPAGDALALNARPRNSQES